MDSLPTIFDVCTPRKDVLDGVVESELAADLARVTEGEAIPEYSDPSKFFAGTYPTKGIKNLLRQVLARLGGRSSTSIFWLNTSFGGGKTHALIALLHAARSPPSGAVSEFVDPALLPRGSVRIAVFDGNNADISNGHRVGEGIRARSPWGEIAYGLAGRSGYRSVDDSADGSAPGADTLMELLGDRPALILLDELAVYLRKAEAHRGAGRQLTAFLTSLIKAVEGSPNAALVYTLAAGGGGDAYSEENLALMDELESVSARKATLLNPTEEGETARILQRRLFERRDDSLADAVVDGYRKTWRSNRDKLPEVVDLPRTVDDFRAGYPLHPDILNTLIAKTSTLEHFQRVRGMLRLLAHVVHDLWKSRGEIKPSAIHLHHFDLGNEDIRLEFTSKLKQDAFASAIEVDIACDDADKTSQAQRLDQKHYQNMLPFTTYVARAIFLHTLAFNPHLKGIDDRNLRYSVLSPGTEIGYIDEALDRFRDESQYLDDNLEKPMQFQAAPNLNQAIRRAEQSLDDPELEDEIDRRVGMLFKKGEFDLYLFPVGHEDVPDDTGRPKLVVPKYTRVSTSNPESPPEAVQDIFQYKSIGDGIRLYRNNLVFLVAFEDGVDAMYAVARRHLAISRLSAQDSISGFADYQRKEILDRWSTSDDALEDAILRCYKYLYYPVKGDALHYAAIGWKGSGGQRSMIEELRHRSKVRTDKDLPDLPESLIPKIHKLKTGEMTTLDFRNEFYRATALPILLSDRVFRDGILGGIETGIFVYRSGELICGKDDPACTISIDADSVVYTTAKAKSLGIWPASRPEDPSGGIKDDSGDNSSRRQRGQEHTRRQNEMEDDHTPEFDASYIRIKDKPSAAVRGVLDELRKHGINRVSQMQIRSGDDVFPLLSVVGRLRGLEARLKIEGDYNTTARSVFRFEFDGSLKDAEPVREFLKSQMKEASEGNIDVSLEIDFKEAADVGRLEDLAGRLRLVDNDIEISDIAGLR